MHRRYSLLASLAFCAALIVWGLNAPQRSEAMPPFAQAEGQNCTLCHTLVPGLNSYGRYILRTFYGAIGADTFHGTSPAWVNEQISGRSTGKLDTKAPSLKNTFANTSIDLSGLAGHWSYRAEQSIWSNGQAGSLGNFWVGYDNFFKGDGQFRVGKFGRPVAAVFSNNWYRTGMSMTSIGVASHTYALSGSDWATEFSYEHGSFAGEVGYFLQANTWPNSATFTIAPGAQRSVSYQFAYANPARPLEIGVYGSTGSFIVNKDPQPLDEWTGNGFYIMRDANARTHVPGVALIYQITNDNNPGLVGKTYIPPATTHAEALQVEEPLFNGHAMVGARREILNSLGVTTQGTVIDAGFQVAHIPYLFLYGEEAMGNAYTNAPFGRPTWRWALRWAGPLTGCLNDKFCK